MGALLREANTRDVWMFVNPRQIRYAWPDLLRHLGRRRELWGYLLGLDPTRAGSTRERVATSSTHCARAT